MGVLDIIGGIFDVGSKLFNTGYNVYTNQRDYDYQRALQQQVFEREDTAAQRRMQDLQAAGLNPNLAAGSAAQSGAVVSRSNTNDLNMGSALDTISALNQIKLQRQQTDNAKKEGEILDLKFKHDEHENTFYEMEMLHKLGFNVMPFMDTRGNHLGYKYSPKKGNYYFENYEMRPEQEDYYFNHIDEEYKQLENSNKYLDKELKYQTADHIADYIKSGTGLLKFIK